MLVTKRRECSEHVSDKDEKGMEDNRGSFIELLCMVPR